MLNYNGQENNAHYEIYSKFYLIVLQADWVAVCWLIMLSMAYMEQDATMFKRSSILELKTLRNIHAWLWNEQHADANYMRWYIICKLSRKLQLIASVSDADVCRVWFPRVSGMLEISGMMCMIGFDVQRVRKMMAWVHKNVARMSL